MAICLAVLRRALRALLPFGLLCTCAAADKSAEKEFLGSLGSTTITVFPAYVRGRTAEYDERAAAEIARVLAERGLAQTAISAAHVPLGGEWHSNQSRMFRESSAAFCAWLREHPVASRYALMPEYLGTPGRFVGVHYYIADNEGRFVHGSLSNSHWREFKAVKPKAVEDCTLVVLRLLEKLQAPVAKAAR